MFLTPARRLILLSVKAGEALIAECVFMRNWSSMKTDTTMAGDHNGWIAGYGDTCISKERERLSGIQNCAKCGNSERTTGYLASRAPVSAAVNAQEVDAAVAEDAATRGSDGGGGKPGTPAAVPFKRCARCRVVWYCSAECQKADWSTHKAVCVAMS